MLGEKNNVFLIGPMGAGKSTIGKQLSKLLELEFYDADQEIEKSTGANIAWIFDVEGESGFRKRESAVINVLSQKQGIVLATGGGAILDANTRSYLASRGTVIYLYATIAQQLERTIRDKRRPLLQDKENKEDKQATLESLMEKRDPLYREIADIVIMTNRRSIQIVSQEILKALQDTFE